ncbi:unnamed protein product, partial [Didymodactylos carnosus]
IRFEHIEQLLLSLKLQLKELSFTRYVEPQTLTLPTIQTLLYDYFDSERWKLITSELKKFNFYTKITRYRSMLNRDRIDPICLSFKNDYWLRQKQLQFIFDLYESFELVVYTIPSGTITSWSNDIMEEIRIWNDIRQLTYYSVPSMHNKYNDIQNLNLFFPQSMANKFLSYIIEYEPFCYYSLKHLILHKCIDESLLIYLFENCKNIDELSLCQRELSLIQTMIICTTMIKYE